MGELKYAPCVLTEDILGTILQHQVKSELYLCIFYIIDRHEIRIVLALNYFILFESLCFTTEHDKPESNQPGLVCVLVPEELIRVQHMGCLNKEMGVKYLCLDCFRSMWVLLGNLRGTGIGENSCGHSNCKWPKLRP